MAVEQQEEMSVCEKSARNPLAIVLWLIVGTGLAYGISQTVVTAAGLFTG